MGLCSETWSDCNTEQFHSGISSFGRIQNGRETIKLLFRGTISERRSTRLILVSYLSFDLTQTDISLE
jgi:hypothetical protein